MTAPPSHRSRAEPRGARRAARPRARSSSRAPLSSRALEGRSVALIFQKPSTRTRVSFEVGIDELGGHPVVLRSDELQLSRGEALRDTALVLSRHVAAIGLRTGPDEALEELAALQRRAGDQHAERAPPPLPGARRPAHAARGVRRARRACGSPTSATATTSPARWRCSARSPACDVAIASPAGYALEDDLAPPAGATGSLDAAHATRARPSPARAAVYTDVWVSMGDEETAEARRRAALAAYRVDDALLDAAAPGAFAMHDLPAHPGEEITAEVLYGARQRIWDQAENRRHAQKALLELLVGIGMMAAPAHPDGHTQARPQRGDELELDDRLARLRRRGRRAPRRRRLRGVRGRRDPRRPRARGRAQAQAQLRARAHARGADAEPGADRAARRSPGVPWQVLPYERQLEIKHGQVRRGAAADRQASRASSSSRSCPPLEQWRYRNKLEYSFGDAAERRARVRLPRPGGRHAVVADRGLPARLRARQPRARARAAWCREQGLGAWERGRGGERSPAGASAVGPGARRARAAAQPRRARRPAHGPAPGAAGHAPTASSTRARSRRRSPRRWASSSAACCGRARDSLAETTAGGETELVWGEAELPERLGELDLRISPEAFFQTNTEMAELLYGVAVGVRGARGLGAGL